MLCESIDFNENKWRIAATAVCAAAVIGVAILAIRKAHQDVALDKADYAQRLRDLCPEQMQAWEDACSYESLCKEVRADWANVNTELFQEQHVTMVPHRIGNVTIYRPHVYYVTRSRWVDNLSRAQFADLLKGTELHQRLSDLAYTTGRSTAESLHVIFENTIPAAGPSPVPLKPVAAWDYFAASCKIAGAAALASGGVTAAWLI